MKRFPNINSGGTFRRHRKKVPTILLGTNFFESFHTVNKVVHSLSLSFTINWWNTPLLKAGNAKPNNYDNYRLTLDQDSPVMTMTTPPKAALGHQQHSASTTMAYKGNELSADKFKLLKKQIREISEVRRKTNKHATWIHRLISLVQQNEALTKDLSRAKKRLRRLAKEKK